MTTATQSAPRRTTSAARVKPSRVDPNKPFSLAQDLEPFGTWTSNPILVPPKDLSQEMAETMIQQSGLFTSRQTSWNRIVESHQDRFTQVREIEMTKASIRLPKGKLFVSVTEQKDFDKITDSIPACVQTRLDEFLAGRGNARR